MRMTNQRKELQDHYEVVDTGNQTNAGNWIARAHNEDEGMMYGARFFGWHAEERAREYAAWKNAGNGWKPTTALAPANGA